jgi:hypothetical protein
MPDGRLIKFQKYLFYPDYKHGLWFHFERLYSSIFFSKQLKYSVNRIAGIDFPPLLVCTGMVHLLRYITAGWATGDAVGSSIVIRLCRHQSLFN